MVFFIFIQTLIEIFCKQTVETLIRPRIFRRMICVCNVCLCHTKRTLGLYGLTTKSADDNNNMKNYSACNKLRSCDLKMATGLSLMSFHQLDLI